MFNFGNSTIDTMLKKHELSNKKKKVVKQKVEEEELDKTFVKLQKLLNRKDVREMDNDKVDALRMFMFYLNDEDGITSANKLVKFLK